MLADVMQACVSPQLVHVSDDQSSTYCTRNTEKMGTTTHWHIRKVPPIINLLSVKFMLSKLSPVNKNTALWKGSLVATCI